MCLKKVWLPLLLLGTIFNCHSQARRIRVERPLQQEQAEESLQYYAAEPQEEDENQRQRVVLVSSADQYNGLYGQQSASSRNAQADDNYIPRVPVKAREQSRTISSREKESNNRAPPVQTIRNYSKVNDDGSFTFGYEAADGSFKEETRGTDCVVRGKYGYIDPDGNKREFTYVSGNPCDPNAPKEEEEEELPEDENVPQNYPVQPVRPILRQRVPVSTPKPVTLFQQNYEQTEEEQPEPEQLLRPTPTPAVRQPTYSVRPQYYQQPAAQAQEQVYSRPRVQPTTPSSVYRQSLQPVTITPRPQPTQSTRTQLPATTYRPQLLQVAVTPRPSLLYTPKPNPTYTPSKQLDFDAEFHKFQQDNVISQTPKSNRPDNQIYSSALVYNPATGQYNNQLYQSVAQTDGDFSFSQSIQPYVAQQSYQRPTALQQIAAPQRPAPQPQRTASQYATARPLLNNQAAYQAQQAEQLFQNSAQLYAQQQKVREQQQQQSQRTATQSQPPVYYIQPSIDQTGALGASQIDAFLRGHNIQF